MTLIYKFPNEIRTNASGNQALTNFYHFCCGYTNVWITIDWSGLNYMDANLSAVILAMVHKLKKERGLKFYLNYEDLKGGMNIFWRNGLAHYIFNTGKQASDERDSTIPIKAFKIADVDSFTDYIEKKLLKHRGVEDVKFGDKEKVKNSYFEIFNNIEIHAQTAMPIFACGQLFPQQNKLIFTLVDLGVGFLKNIREFTNTTDKINTAADAISWAIKGHSTKTEAAGGTGLKKILFYCMKNNGHFHIVSDDCYWQYDGAISNTKIANPFVGATIHLIFSYNN
ncbi:hypothetical protein FHW88_005204 [Mucilaginibacter sp. SG538B]|uniref:hypothetical protein n=1 Tax=Mucilaginibacter sp. SG538B TaxID=2587021 RepID=UPI00159E8B84|nr:hypothetical protein [Mucilaginibacter sp. SG538B]NVM66886.1 hypothetical protein [Mucilaginibacter sp. SG538B]